MTEQQKQSSGYQIKIGALLSYLAIAVNILAGLIYTPWMIRTVGTGTYGLYTLATSLIALFVTDFGIGTAAARFIAQYRAEDRLGKINSLLGIVCKLYLLLDGIIAAALLLVYFHVDVIYANLTEQELHTCKNILLIIIFYNLVSFPFSSLGSILTAYENFFQLKMAACLNKICTVLLTVLALLLGGGIYALVLVQVGINFLTLFYQWQVVRHTTPVKADFRASDSSQLRAVLTFSVWATAASLMSRLIFNITPSILAAFVSAAGVTVFGLASTLEGYVFIFSDAINGLFLARSTRATLSANREQDMLSLMTRVGRINLSIVALIVMGFLVAGREFVTLWLGPGNELVYRCAILMMIPDLLYFPQQVGRTLLIVDGKQKYQAMIYTVMGLVNVVLALTLIPRIGVLGSGISIGASYMIRLLLMSGAFQRVLKIDMKKFYWECFGKLCLPILLSGFAGFLIFRLPIKVSWPLFLLKCAGMTAIYTAVMWLMGWNRSEKNLLRSLIAELPGKM